MISTLESLIIERIMWPYVSYVVLRFCCKWMAFIVFEKNEEIDHVVF